MTRAPSGKLRISFVVAACLSMLLALVLLITTFSFDRLFHTLLYKKLAMLPNSLMYDSWIQPKVPIYFSIYMYNLTNMDDMLNGAKPHVEEVGPYVYRETRQRFDLNFSSETKPERVRYKHRIFYNFVPELSIGDPSDAIITTLDLYSAGVRVTSSWLGMLRDPFTTTTAQKAMWMNDRSMWSGAVGLFGSHNGTQIDEFLMDTGVNNPYHIGKIYEANGLTELDIWDTKQENMINGSDGTLAPPGMRAGAVFEVFVPGICRTAKSYAVGQTTTVHRDDIQVTVFSPTKPEGQNNIPDPLPFCGPKNPCPPKGLVALKPCLESTGVGLPLFLSQPRFFEAQPDILEAFTGIEEANSVNHSTWIHIEPTTGLVLEAYKRVQFNMYLDTSLSPFSKMNQSVYFPMAWISETAIADKPSLDRLHRQLFRPKKMIYFLLAIATAMFALLAVVLIAALILHPRLRPPSRRSKLQVGATPSSPLGTSVTSSGDAKYFKYPKMDDPLTEWPSKASCESNPPAPEAECLLKEQSNPRGVIA